MNTRPQPRRPMLSGKSVLHSTENRYRYREFSTPSSASLRSPFPTPPQLGLGTSDLTPRILDFRLGKLPAGLGIALLNLGLLITPVMMSRPAQGAERIYIPYGPVEFSLPIASLELYAKEGKIDQELAVYAGYLDEKQLEQLRQILVTPIDVTPLAISQFLYSPQGEIILDRMGQI